jgi:dipeptidyl aminopeptidase/acylaminoacyl peptidase
MATTTACAGLKEAKARFESKQRALVNEYVQLLKRERRTAIKFGKTEEVIAIDAEIKRYEVKDKNAISGEWKVTYTTGIRNYRFLGDGKLYFVEQRTHSTYRQVGDVIVIKHPAGEIERWTKQPDGYTVLFKARTRDIDGLATPKRKR